MCALFFAGSTTPTDAQMPGPHPEYLHAIRDLRQARGLLQHNFTQSKHVQAATAALPEINAAINDLKSASKLDEKNLGDVPPPATNLDPDGRFHMTAQLLSRAHHAVSQPESDPVAMPYKDRALRHIDAASAAIAQAL